MYTNKKNIIMLLQHIQKAGRKKRTFHLEFTKKEHTMTVQASSALPVLPVVMTMVIKLQ